MNIILELDCNEKFKKIINEINNLQKYPNVLSKPNKIFEAYSTLKNDIPFNYVTSYDVFSNPVMSNSFSYFSYYKSNLDNLYKVLQEFFNNLNSVYSSIIDMYIIYYINNNWNFNILYNVRTSFSNKYKTIFFRSF